MKMLNDSENELKTLNEQQKIPNVSIEELNLLKKEHEDLLLLLAEQDKKIHNYRRILVNHGEVLSDADEEP
ncbi:hypothetical protein Mgra_00001127 [Meloidogyne graminicola]|uniref:Uso1/p115-like vesicle tethering protein C-terminal domain-containing protein n=1 Tax=Meloidogyne graminicola TaxID=189291 RepID=A0A8T0A1P7_9BILA|nr:hypothetical protein Mgra_00001127 [Meloidogyne graminicola]